jgi:hypothetical protein
MFTNHYEGWRVSRISTTFKYISKDFFKDKLIYEFGAGHANIGNVFQTEIDCQVVAYEGRGEHVDTIKNNIEKGIYSPKLLVKQHNFEEEFTDKKCDIIIHWGLLYHLSDVVKHLNNVLQYTDYLLLETEVCNINECIVTQGLDPNSYDQSISLKNSSPSQTFVEKILYDNEFDFKIIKDSDLNHWFHRYDWEVDPTKPFTEFGVRRFWICWKKGLKSPISDSIMI